MSIITSRHLREISRIDPIFAKIQATYGAPPSWSRPPGYETLCRIILEQQVSLMSAKATYEKLLKEVDSFSAQHVVLLSDERMRAATVSRQKASYIKGLGQLILDGKLGLEALDKLSHDEAKEKLISVRGIGHWTAEVYLMFCLQAPDIFPKGDVALNNTVKELKGLTTTEEVYTAAEHWAPHRSTAAYLLWHYYLCKRGRDFVI